MVFLSRVLAVLPKARITWYTPEQICRGKDAITDILPLTLVNIRLVLRGGGGVVGNFSNLCHYITLETR